MKHDMKIENMDIGMIRPDPKNPRKGDYDQGKLEGMAQTFKVHSLIQPIEIDEKNQIIIGELRWRAAQIAGLKKIPTIRKVGLSKNEKLERQLIENHHHQKVDLAECRNELKKLLNVKYLTLEKKSNRDEGISELSKRIGVSRPYLSQILDLDDAPESVKKALDNKEISTQHAIHIQHAPKEVQSGLLKLSKSGSTEREIREIKNKLKEFPEPEQRREEVDRIIQRKQTAEQELEWDLMIAKGEREPKIIMELERESDQRLINSYQFIKDRVFEIYHDHIRHMKSDKKRNEAIKIVWDIYNFLEKQLKELGEIKVVE